MEKTRAQSDLPDWRKIPKSTQIYTIYMIYIAKFTPLIENSLGRDLAASGLSLSISQLIKLFHNFTMDGPKFSIVAHCLLQGLKDVR